MSADGNVQGGQFHQQSLFPRGAEHARVFDPVPFVVEGVQRYQRSRGAPAFSAAHLAGRQVHHGLGGAVAAEYAQRRGQPVSARTMASFRAMRDTINRQYEYMTKPEAEGGMGITVEVGPSTYGSPAAMAADLSENRRIKVQSTASTSGLAEGAHAFFTNEENDRFRAVHDVFAHATTGRSFSRHGEDAAYLAHAQTFPKVAHEALASETRGQNMQMNYGTGEFVGVGEPQAVVGMPSWAVRPESRGPKVTRRRSPPPPRQPRLF